MGRPAVRIGLAVFVFHLIFIWWGAPDSWHPDEIAPREAVRMARIGDLVPLEPGNPTLQAYVLTVLVALPERALRAAVELPLSPIEAVTGASRVLSALIGALLAVGVFRLVSARSSDRTGLVAALIVTVNSLVVSGARSATVDLPAAALLVWALARAIRARTAQGPGRGFLVAGLLGGLAVATKFTMLLPGMAGIGAAAVLRSDSRRTALLAGASGGLVGFLAGMPLAALNPYDAAATFVIGHHHVAMLLGEDAPRAGLSALAALALSFGPGLVLAVVAGLLVRRPDRDDLVWLAAVAAVLVPVMLARFFAPRYLLPVVAPLVVVALPRLRLTRTWATAVAGYALLHAGLVLGQYPTDPRHEAATWLDETCGPDAVVAITRYGPSPRRVETVDLPIPHPGRVAYPAMEERATLTIPRRLGRLLGGGETPQARRAIAGMLAPARGDVEPTFEALRARGVGWVVVSSFASDRFEHSAVAKTYPTTASLLRDLREERRGALRARRFAPLGPEWIRPPVAFTGPVLVVYRLEHEDRR